MRAMVRSSEVGSEERPTVRVQLLLLKNVGGGCQVDTQKYTQAPDALSFDSRPGKDHPSEYPSEQNDTSITRRTNPSCCYRQCESASLQQLFVRPPQAHPRKTVCDRFVRKYRNSKAPYQFPHRQEHSDPKTVRQITVQVATLQRANIR